MHRYYYQYYIACIEIKSGLDLLPYNQVSFDSDKKQWTVKDYLDYGDDLGSLISIDTISNHDVSEYQEDYQKYLTIQRKNSQVTSEERKMADKYAKKQQEYDSIIDYFFPKTTHTTSLMCISRTLNDVIVVLYDGII